MKFFIVTCLKESRDDVIKIFKQANIHVFSSTDLVGYKDDQPVNLLEEWFASGEEEFDSVMIFSFTSNENALLGMDLVRKYNEGARSGFPARAFIVPVEDASF